MADRVQMDRCGSRRRGDNRLPPVLRFRDSNHIDASINLVLRSAHLILRRACPTWGARLEGLRASRRTATSETEPAAILRDGASRLLRMRSVSLSSIARSVGFMESIYYGGAGQYFGRCEIAHSRACSMGACGGSAARNFCTVGNASIRSRHRQKAGYFGYIVLPSGVSPKP
jgi:hypothetical protein